MAKATQNRSEGETFPVKTPKVFAAVCPRNSAHESTHVYKTEGRTRRCKCNDCGHTWKQVGPLAGETDSEDESEGQD